MTPEQQREQWLKRILPALGVLVVYFVIISGFITGKTKKAEDDYNALVSKGIDANMLPSKQQEQAKLKDELAELATEEKSIRDKLGGVNGFLAGKDTQNDTLDRISVIFANNALQVIEEKRSDNVKVVTLSKSFVELQKYLSELSVVPPVPVPVPVAAPVPVPVKAATTAATTTPAPPVPPPPPAPVPVKPATPDTTSTVNLHTIHYYGSYNDNYRALNELLTSNIKVLPVSLTMQMPKTNNDSTISKQLEWNLILWL